MPQPSHLSEIIVQLRHIMESGNEQEARRFLMEHLDEFPQSVRDGVITSLFEEALEKTARNAQVAERRLRKERRKS